MKKLLPLLFLTIILSYGYSITEELSKDPVLVDWFFEPEVGTKLGFNIDNQKVGFLGTAKLTLKSEIHPKKDRDFRGKGDLYGYIQIKDFEILVELDDKLANYDSTTDKTNTSPLRLKRGTVEGKIFLGPVYMILKNTGQDEVTFIETLDDSDLDFSTIGYSVIPAFYTGSYSGARTSYRTSEQNAATGNIIDNALTLDARNLSAFSVGLILPEIITLELGTSLGYSYKENIPFSYNPYAVSLFMDFTILGTVVENLSLKTKIAAQGGFEERNIAEEYNPITLGLILGYKYPLGVYTITPKVALEMQFVSLEQYRDPALTTAPNVAPTTNLFVPFEIALGANFDWLSRGGTDSSEDEGDYLSFSNRDIKVQDGISLGMIYGQAPHINYREITVPYVGLKIAMWESEGKNKPGILNGLQLGMILNINYALGGSTDLKNSLKASESKRELTYGNRLDVGLGLEASYSVLFLKPYIGVLIKAFNLNEGTITQEIVDGGTSTTTSYDDYINDTDIRMKVGIDILEIIGNTTLTAEWVSGDLINDNAITGGPDYTDYDYFENNVADDNNSVMNSNMRAKFGYIAIGAKITF